MTCPRQADRCSAGSTATSAPTAPPNSHPDLAAAVESGADRSIQIHVCHGARRQAEVMRDAVLHVLAADHTLEPRDVVIMTPDLETFAPLLEAAFPSTEDRTVDGLPDLRLRIADRSPSATNPLVRFTANLLSIADGRLEAGVVRELVARPVVQHRFGLDTDTTSELIGLIDDATIAWGLDSAERESWGAGTNDERTWTRGLDRILSGVFYADDDVRVRGRHGADGRDRGRRRHQCRDPGQHRRPSWSPRECCSTTNDRCRRGPRSSRHP